VGDNFLKNQKTLGFIDIHGRSKIFISTTTCAKLLSHQEGHIMDSLFRVLLWIIIFFAGWYAGAKFGIPADLNALAEQLMRNKTDISFDTIDENTDNPVQIASAPSLKPSPTEVKNSSDNTHILQQTNGLDALSLCKTKVSNAPAIDEMGHIINFAPLGKINTIDLLIAPVTKGCLSSGYGPRGNRKHKGVDFFSRSGGEVVAAANGVIIDHIYREQDFGNMIVIDHGNGVFTRYAHLAHFTKGLSEGRLVSRGTILGPIGQTGRAFAPHLHYEILTGRYVSGAGSFGLKTHDPMNLK